MAAPIPIIPISYKNNSGVAIPSYGVIQLQGNCDVVAGPPPVYSVQAVEPSGVGPYAVDLGQGTTASGAGAYGQCVIPLSHLCWVYYIGAAAPGTAWSTEVGPVSGHWYMDATGKGYLYAGVFDATNQRILVVEKTSGGAGYQTIMFELVTVDCVDHVATATVIGYTCGAGSPAIGSTVELCDAMRCFLIGAPGALPGRVGLAQQMTLDPSVACSAVYDSDVCPWVITWLVPADFTCT